jgi:hypothetical protein
MVSSLQRPTRFTRVEYVYVTAVVLKIYTLVVGRPFSLLFLLEDPVAVKHSTQKCELKKIVWVVAVFSCCYRAKSEFRWFEGALLVLYYYFLPDVVVVCLCVVVPTTAWDNYLLVL